MRALELLHYLGALDSSSSLTQIGRAMSQFPLDPQVNNKKIMEFLILIAYVDGKSVNQQSRIRLQRRNIDNRGNAFRCEIPYFSSP